MKMVLSNTDYAKMTREELASAENGVKSQKNITAVILGMLVGIAVWSATHRGLFLPILLLVIAFVIGARYSQSEKRIQAEIRSRDTVR
jgi:hypothetical protein